MPTVRIAVTERVTYCREVEMSEAEYHAWGEKLDRLTGREYDKAVEELTDRYLHRDDRDFLDADDLELQDMSVVVTP